MLNRRAVTAAILASTVVPVIAHPHAQLNAERQADIERQLTAFRNELKDAPAIP
jgi:hypothetical protein